MARMMFSINIARSRMLLSYLLVIHGVMIITLAYILDFSGATILTTIVLLLSFIYYAQQYQWLKNGKSIIRVEKDSKQKWTLNYSDGSQRQDLILASSYVTSQLVILYFGKAFFRQRSGVPIMADAVDPDLLRQLRIVCRDPKTFQK